MIQATLFFLPEDDRSQVVREALVSLQPEIPHELIAVDVSKDDALLEEYGERVPVVEIGAYTLNSPFSVVDLKVALSAANTGATRSVQSPGAPARRWGVRLNRGLHFFTRHWLAFFSVIVFVYASLPFVAPTLMNVGATGPARVIYTLYSPFCHQFAFRSFFLFGPQVAYPRELAGTSLVPYGEATGMDEDDVIGARAYLGDETVGYKTALCERDIGIYVGILIAGLVFGAVRGRLKPLPLALWFLLGILPIALDGGTQLISQLGIFPFPPRESTPLLRTATGLLFGVMNVWMAYPYVERAMKDTTKTTAAKLAVAEQRAQQASPAE